MEYDNYRAAMEMITEIFDIETVKWERRNRSHLRFAYRFYVVSALLIHPIPSLIFITFHSTNNSRVKLSDINVH